MTGTALTTVDFSNYARQAAQQARATSSRTITCRAGVFKMGDQELGRQLAVVVLGAVYHNTFFAARWDPNSEANAPTCYAYGQVEAEMRPHASMQSDMGWFQPQTEFQPDGMPGLCSTCPKNVFGTSPTGKGKACQNRARLAVVPAGMYTPRPNSNDFDLHLFEDPNHFEAADVAFINLPVMSATEWWSYQRNLSGPPTHRPPFGAFTRIFSVPDAQSQFRIKFSLIEPAPLELAQVLLNRHLSTAGDMDRGYVSPDNRNK